MARIPQSVIEEIKYRNPIEDVISSYVTLIKAGSNMKGLCPFHSEKTPSFTVYSGSASFYCFGCGAGGDVVSFIMKAENLDYPAALDFLARRVGIKLPENDDTEGYPKGISRTRVIEMNTDAARFYRNLLFDDNIGAAGRAYLTNRRLELPIIKRFGLGYAPDSFNTLRDHMKRLGYKDEELAEGSLCRVSEKNGNLYDFFRNRIMFPIFDVSGNIVAFGGRSLEEKPRQKYMNSLDTSAFKKSRTVFGLNYAKNSGKDHLILVEGNIDVITLHQAGFENAVASLGTSFTSDHARILKKYTEKVVVAYDGDEAGQNATSKAVKLLDEVGIEAKVVKLEGAKDPDEYIIKFGKESFRKIIQGSNSRFDYLTERILSKYRLSDEEAKVRASHDICVAAAEIYSKVERDLFLAKAASKLDVNKKSLEIDTDNYIKRQRRRDRKEQHEKVVVKSLGITDRVNRDYAKYPRAAKLEELLLGIMLVCPEFIKLNKDKNIISGESIVTEFGKRLFDILMGNESDGKFEFSVLNEYMNQDEVSRAQKLMTERFGISNTENVFRETAESLVAESLKINSDGSASAESLEEKIKRLRDDS